MLGAAHCKASDGAVTVRFEDNSSLFVPAEVVSRSLVLAEALLAVDAEGEFILPGQDVQLQSWVDVASVLVYGRTSELRSLDATTITEALVVRPGGLFAIPAFCLCDVRGCFQRD